jgi:hypothetical protein
MVATPREDMNEAKEDMALSIELGDGGESGRMLYGQTVRGGNGGGGGGGELKSSFISEPLGPNPCTLDPQL